MRWLLPVPPSRDTEVFSRDGHLAVSGGHGSIRFVSVSMMWARTGLRAVSQTAHKALAQAVGRGFTFYPFVQVDHTPAGVQNGVPGPVHSPDF